MALSQLLQGGSYGWIVICDGFQLESKHTLCASGGSLIQANRNYKIHHGRARQAKKEIVTDVVYSSVSKRGEE